MRGEVASAGVPIRNALAGAPLRDGTELILRAADYGMTGAFISRQGKLCLQSTLKSRTD